MKKSKSKQKNKSKSDIKVKRENHKNKGYVIVSRNEKGQFVKPVRKWKPDYTIEDYINDFFKEIRKPEKEIKLKPEKEIIEKIEKPVKKQKIKPERERFFKTYFRFTISYTDENNYLMKLSNSQFQMPIYHRGIVPFDNLYNDLFLYAVPDPIPDDLHISYHYFVAEYIDGEWVLDESTRRRND